MKRQKSEDRGQKSESVEADLASADVKTILTISEASDMLGVNKQTLKKYLSRRPDEDMPIPYDAWFKLPYGDIRIYRWGVIKVLSGK